MSKKLFVALFVLSVFIAALIFHLSDIYKDIERIRYENFLKHQYSLAPERERENGKEKEGGKAVDQPDVAAFQEYLMTMDPALGRVPAERLQQAFSFTRQMQLRKSENNPVQWQEVPSNMGGRTRAIMWDPNDASGNKAWAGGVTGGLWYNDDAASNASSWVPVNDFWANLAVSSITYDPTNTQVFYVGTGEAQTALITYRESSGRGCGIYKSADGGQSWELLPSTSNFAYVTDIKVRNENGNGVIYAGVMSGKYMGINHQSIPSDGVYRSSDGGTTWEQVLPNIAGETVPYAPSDIELGADGRIYVGTGRNLDGNGGATILYSDLGTAGNWTVFDDYKTIIESDPSRNIPGRVVLATAPSDANVVYALIADGFVNSENGFDYFYCDYLLKSSDRGLNWTEKNVPDDAQGQNSFAYIAWHALDMVVDPNNANNLFAGGLDLHKSTNSGSSWTRVSDWAAMYSGGGTDYVHADQHIIAFKSGSSSEALFGSDGGIFFTASANNTYPVFEQRNNNYNTLQFYSGALHPTAGTANYLGGLQDNGTVYYTGSPFTINDMIDGGDGAYCFYDKDNPSVFISSVYYNAYTFWQNGNYAGGSNTGDGIFINPASLDSRDNKLYANAVMFNGSYAGKILRITGIPNNPQTGYITIASGSSAIFSNVTVSPYAPAGKSTLFAGTQSGKLYKVENAQASPLVTEIGSPDFPMANISCVAIGGSEDTLLVTFSNYGVSSVWQTTNGGTNWTEKETNLPDMPIRWAIYHPQNSKQVMLATETGIWTTENINTTTPLWEPNNDGLANVRVDMLQIRESDNTVLASTHGRGLSVGTWTYNPGVGIKELTNSQCVLSPNPAHNQLSVSFDVKKVGDVNITFYTLGGKTVWEQKFRNCTDRFSHNIDVSILAKGVYLVNIQKGKESLSRKVMVE